MIKIRKCIVCGKEFKYKTTRGNRGGLGINKNYRSKNAITCSHKCSNIYNRKIKNLYHPEASSNEFF